MTSTTALLLLLGTALGLAGQVAAAPPLPRGVSPADAHLYSASPFFCPGLTGLLPIPPARLNDGYCDCVDGSDEPGALGGWVRERKLRPTPLVVRCE